ncbi:MAG: IS200/IS605 family transposase [Patescibacteria group bacterium]|nr:IS200/IS605 family transposase [Patescibacteria group bacterium]
MTNNIRKTHHTTYDTKYHLVWSPKRRRHIKRPEVRKTIEDTIKEIAQNHDMTIEELEISEDHVHIFISFPPRYSISKVVGMLKSISSSVVQENFPDIMKDLRLWKTNLWERGFFVRTVGDEVTSDIIKNYIKHLSN